MDNTPVENLICYRCGQQGHLRAQCPGAAPLPAPHARARGFDPVPARRSPEEIADARLHAERIRSALGWAPGRTLPEDVPQGTRMDEDTP